MARKRSKPKPKPTPTPDPPTRKRRTGRAARLESLRKAAGVAGRGGSTIGKFAKGLLPGAIPASLLALMSAGEDPEYEALLAQIQGELAGPGAAERAGQEVAGLDELMRTEREVAAQSPPGTPAATPIVDRLQVLMPELMTKLRQRIKGGLWSELAEGEVLIESGPTSREIQKAQDKELEFSLRDELGFLGGPSIDSQALIG